jgi:uncharacterized protein YchJ
MDTLTSEELIRRVIEHAAFSRDDAEYHDLLWRTIQYSDVSHLRRMDSALRTEAKAQGVKLDIYDACCQAASWSPAEQWQWLCDKLSNYHPPADPTPQEEREIIRFETQVGVVTELLGRGDLPATTDLIPRLKDPSFAASELGFAVMQILGERRTKEAVEALFAVWDGDLSETGDCGAGEALEALQIIRRPEAIAEAFARLSAYRIARPDRNVKEQMDELIRIFNTDQSIVSFAALMSLTETHVPGDTVAALAGAALAQYPIAAAQVRAVQVLEKTNDPELRESAAESLLIWHSVLGLEIQNRNEWLAAQVRYQEAMTKKFRRLQQMEIGVDDWDAAGGLDRSGDEILEPYVRAEPKVGRNDPCPCGSGKKHKKCCL